MSFLFLLRLLHLARPFGPFILVSFLSRFSKVVSSRRFSLVSCRAVSDKTRSMGTGKKRGRPRKDAAFSPPMSEHMALAASRKGARSSSREFTSGSFLLARNQKTPDAFSLLAFLLLLVSQGSRPTRPSKARQCRITSRRSSRKCAFADSRLCRTIIFSAWPEPRTRKNLMTTISSPRATSQRYCPNQRKSKRFGDAFLLHFSSLIFFSSAAEEKA